MKPKEIIKEVNEFVKCVDELIHNEYSTKFKSLSIPKMEVKEGSKYYKLICDHSVWGFISKYDGFHKGSPVKVGDLMMAAGWKTPARHSRGNIIDGTASYGVYGPTYLK